jgi:hypothetical protein
MSFINFTDPQLQTCYDGNLREAGDVAEDLRQVRALMTTYQVFLMFEGPHSSRVHESIQHLLLPELRPGLRRWYQRADAETGPVAVQFRDHLSQLAGENLEAGIEIPCNPS